MKIKLEYLKLKDAEDILEGLKETEFKLNRMNNNVTLEQEKKWIKQTIQEKDENKSHNFKILANRRFAGVISIRIEAHKNYIGDVGYWVRQSEQGKGVATKALKELIINAKKLNLKAMMAVTDPKNFASQKVMEKNGFERIGLLKKYMLIKGKLHDRFLYWKIL